MHIDKRLEAVFLAAVKEPVDGPLLVGLAVVGIEVVQEITADHIAGRTFAAQGIGNEFEVFFQGVAAVDRLDEFDKPAYHIVLEILIVADGDDVVFIRRVGGIFAAVPLATSVGKPFHIQGVAAKHTAHGVGDQGDNDIPPGEHIAGALQRGRDVVFGIHQIVDGHILVGHDRVKFVLQAVDVDEDAVQSFFIGFQLVEAFFTLVSPCAICTLQEIGYGFTATICTGKFHVIFQADKWMYPEVPRSFKGVPILFSADSTVLDQITNIFPLYLVDNQRYTFKRFLVKL